MQVAAAQAELAKERQARTQASTEVQMQHEAALAAFRQSEIDLEEQITVLKQELAAAVAAADAGKENSRDLDGADTNGAASGTRSARISAMQDKEAELQKSVRCSPDVKGRQVDASVCHHLSYNRKTHALLPT